LNQELRSLRIESEYVFEKRSKGQRGLCYVLAGFKNSLWNIVFERLSLYVPKDMDVCIISGGVYSKELSMIAEKNNWSYLSSKEKGIGRIQNVVINLHPEAEMIYKMDEDMLVTKGCFEELKKTYELASKRWSVGFVAPLIPINFYGYIRVLELSNKMADYEQKFGEAKYIWQEQVDSSMWMNPEAAKYLWSEIDIDALNEKLMEKASDYRVCPTWFTIGFVVFTRNLWEEMDYFYVFSNDTPALGADETQLNQYLKDTNKVIAVSENTVVGHFSSHQTDAHLQKLFIEHPEYFKLDEQYKK